MIIFVDETGAFANPQGKANVVSCIGALMIPEEEIDSVFAKFKELKRSWGFNDVEVKGSQLQESQFAALIEMLAQTDILLKIIAIDLGVTTPEDVRTHRTNQSDLIRKASSKTKDEFSKELMRLADSVSALSEPLYVQFQMMILLLDDVLQISTLYFSQRRPLSLGSFVWVVDEKETKKKTAYEELWSDLCKPFLQTISINKPMLQLNGADYSAFEKFSGERDVPPQHLAEKMSEGKQEKFLYVDIVKLMECLEFKGSKDELGIQLVDIFVSAARRAFAGTLQEEGWRNLGKLMVQPEKNNHTIRFITLGSNTNTRTPYAKIVDIFDLSTKKILK